MRFDLRNLLLQALYGILQNGAWAIIAAICAALGFGPDKWASFLLSGLPFLLTPGVLRLAFLLIASLALFSMLRHPIMARSGTTTVQVKRLAAILVMVLPFLIGAFYIASNSTPIPQYRRLSADDASCLTKGLLASKELKGINIAVGNTGGDRDSANYAYQFLLLVDSLQMADDRENEKFVNGDRSLGLINPDYSTGIYIGVENRLKPSPEGIALMKTLTSCKFQASFNDMLMLPHQVWLIMGRAS
jgi:hypothetical protein